jgi:hypothetical protein
MLVISEMQRLALEQPAPASLTHEFPIFHLNSAPYCDSRRSAIEFHALERVVVLFVC